MLEQRQLGAFLKCAFAGLPADVRDPSVAMGWLLVTDSADMRHQVARELAKSEGVIDSWQSIETMQNTDLLRSLNATKVSFRSGSHLIFLSGAVEAETVVGAQMAMIEMWTLGQSDMLIVTEGSSFGDVARSLFQRPTFVTTLGGRCYPSPTLAPLGAGLMYYEQSKCFTNHAVKHDWLWKLQQST